MMAVDSKQGGTTSAAPGTPGPAATLAGMPALSANGAANKRKRPSSLLAAATSLPSVESSLDEFIAKANETLVDPSAFNSELVRREEDEKRKEHDALRWKATEQQMREAHAREEALRRQLAGLQGQLAEAEARAAVAGSGGSQDGIIADLRLRLTMADEKIRTSEEKLRLTEVRAGKLEQDLAAAQSAAASAAAAPVARDSLVGIGDAEAEERVRIAEAKATKAIAAAKAASAGLTVSSADIAAIESGLAISTIEPAKKTSWGAIIAAFVVGGAIMFAVGFLLNNKKDKPAASAAGAQPAATQEAQGAPEPTPTKPTVTPIEDKTETAPAAQPDEAAARDAADQAAADQAAADQAAADQAAAEEAEAAAKAEKAAAKPATKRAKAKAKAKKAPKKAAKKANGGLADPFGGGDSAPAPKKKKSGGTSGGIVDPF